MDNEFAKKLKNKVEKYAQGSANTSSNAGSSDEACDNYECEDEDSDHGESSEDSNATSIGKFCFMLLNNEMSAVLLKMKLLCRCSKISA